VNLSIKKCCDYEKIFSPLIIGLKTAFFTATTNRLEELASQKTIVVTNGFCKISPHFFAHNQGVPQKNILLRPRCEKAYVIEWQVKN
jgi:hypothetical protein